MRRSGFGAAISHAVARSSIVFCNSISRYRIVMAASKLLVAAAACVILCLLAETRESCWSGCIKAAIVICEQIFSFFALVIFLLGIVLKSASQSSFFFALAPGSGFGAAISHAVARSSIVFCNSISRCRIVMVVSKLLGAAACAILLSFAAESCESY